MNCRILLNRSERFYRLNRQARDLINTRACIYRDLDARSRHTKSVRKIASYVATIPGLLVCARAHACVCAYVCAFVSVRVCASTNACRALGACVSLCQLRALVCV